MFNQSNIIKVPLKRSYRIKLFLAKIKKLFLTKVLRRKVDSVHRFHKFKPIAFKIEHGVENHSINKITSIKPEIVEVEMKRIKQRMNEQVESYLLGKGDKNE